MDSKVPVNPTKKLVEDCVTCRTTRTLGAITDRFLSKVDSVAELYEGEIGRLSRISDLPKDLDDRVCNPEIEIARSLLRPVAFSYYFNGLGKEAALAELRRVFEEEVETMLAQGMATEVFNKAGPIDLKRMDPICHCGEAPVTPKPGTISEQALILGLPPVR